MSDASEYPAAPPGGWRVRELLRDLDRALRSRRPERASLVESIHA